VVAALLELSQQLSDANTRLVGQSDDASDAARILSDQTREQADLEVRARAHLADLTDRLIQFNSTQGASLS
jgi:hypothetical protein